MFNGRLSVAVSAVGLFGLVVVILGIIDGTPSADTAAITKAGAL